MKRTAPARPTQRRRTQEGVSLFPFLAVLICTMGALILLLVVMAHRAQVQAAQQAEARSSEDQKKLERDREDTQWRTGHLRKALEKTREQLADARLELGHLESHAAELREKLVELRRAWEQLSQSGSDTSGHEAQLAQLQSEIARAESELAQAQAVAARRRGSYAIVPYEGPHGTRRRPIYLECRADSVVFLPEGVAVGPGDVEGLLGPDNPLASAVRAAREYLLRQGAIDYARSGEPYPLLLVRPSGVASYHAAREALQSWDSEFGYELVGEDWQFELPPADPALAETIRQALEAARLRQRLLAEAAPRHFNRYGGTAGAAAQQYTVSPGRGGVVPYGGGPTAMEPAHRRPGGRAGRPRPDDNEWSTSREGATGTGRAGDAAAQPPAGASSSQRGSTAAGSLQPGSSQPGSAQPGATGSPAAGAGGRASQSGATSRGKHWALPEDLPPAATPLTQPIRIECYPDRLVLVAQQGRTGGRTIALPGPTEEAIDEFVAAVWDYTDTWGIAGNNMYWRPVLNVYVAPGAEGRAADLEVLLEDSGLDVRRK